MARRSENRVPFVNKNGEHLRYIAQRDARDLEGSGEAKQVCRRCQRADFQKKPFCGANGQTHSIAYMATDLYRNLKTSPASITFGEMQALVGERSKAFFARASKKFNNWAEASSMNRSITVTAYHPSDRSVFA